MYAEGSMCIYLNLIVKAQQLYSIRDLGLKGSKCLYLNLIIADVKVQQLYSIRDLGLKGSICLYLCLIVKVLSYLLKAIMYSGALN